MSRRYPYGFAVAIPHIADGERKYAMLSTNDAVCTKRIKRVIRQWVQSFLGRQIHPIELAALMKSVRKHDEPMMYFVKKFSQQTEAPADAQTDS